MTNSRGFSLVETLIAATIVTGALGAIAQLFTLSAQATSSARATTMAVILAQQRMEQLRSLTWGFDAVGLRPSPSGSLVENTDGYYDFLDRDGRPLAVGTAEPPGTVYVRRWSVEPLPTSPGDTMVLQVIVTNPWRWGAARLVTIRTRKVS